MFWALVKGHFNFCLAARGKMSQSKPKTCLCRYDKNFIVVFGVVAVKDEKANIFSKGLVRHECHFRKISKRAN